MKLVRYGMALVCSALLASAAVAEEEKIGSAPGDDVGTQVDCDLTGYKNESVTFPAAVPIPDGVAAGVTVGPLVLPADGMLIDDVIIDVSLRHTWIGDLIGTVGYDANCDGTVDVTSTILCRVGRATCVGGAGFGCAANFGTADATPLCAPYFFSDAVAAIACPTTTNLPAGCYKPTGVGAGLLSVFDGMQKGGCWFLNVSDNAAADTGAICGWSVHIKNRGTVGVEPAAWGTVKTLFN